MTDYHVVSYEDNSEKDGLRVWQKILIGLGTALLLIALVAFSYYLGTQQTSDSTETEPSPTQSLSPIPSPIETATQSATTTIKGAKSTPSVTPTPRPKSIILDSIDILSGYRSSNGGGNNTAEIKVGRNQNLVTRGFVSFDLSDLPSSAKIVSATIRLYQSEIIGSPYQSLGSIKIDHLTYGESLDEKDYGTSALVSNLTTLSNNKTVQWKEADVTKSVKDDIANARSRSQFRLHFVEESTGGDTEGDFAHFNSANNYPENSGHPPELVIEYK